MVLDVPSILVTDNWEKELLRCIDDAQFSSLVVLTDKSLSEHHSMKGLLKKAQVHLEMDASEGDKSLEQCMVLWEKLLANEVDRKALIVILGGGITCDLGGFAASTYKRGIPFMLVPTTLLAMADASVGGKVGVNFRGYKNVIGVFQDSYATIIDPAFLDTQSDRQILAGYAEILKHGIIHDPLFFESLVKGPKEVRDWLDVLNRSLEIKWHFASQDPTEKGLRKALNFGHTYAHAIESMGMDKGFSVLHGEAVAWGMVFEALLSNKMGLLDAQGLERIVEVIMDLYEDRIPTDLEPKDAWQRIQNDKKNQGGAILFTLLKSLGQVEIHVPATFQDFQQTWVQFEKLKKYRQ